MAQADLFYRFGIALIIGILVGLERQRSAQQTNQELMAGVRTFALFALAGCTAAMLSDLLNSPWPFVVMSLPSLVAFWQWRTLLPQVEKDTASRPKFRQW